MEKAPTRAFSWLKAPTSAFTFKTLLRHYACGTDGSFYSTNFCTNVLLANAGMGMEKYGGVGSGHVITITKQIIGNCGQFMVWPLDQWPASLCEVITAKKRGENFNPFTGQKLISCSLYHPSRIAAAVLCQTSSHDTNLCHQLPWIKLNQHYVILKYAGLL